MLLSVVAVSVAASAMPSSALSELAGRYTHRFKNGDVTGRSFTSTDIVEIYPVSRDRALVNLELNFFNGHSCSIDGKAQLESGKLVYREEQDAELDQPDCVLKIWRDRTSLRWEDGGSCRSHCGARGGLSQGNIPVASRRMMKAPPSPQR
jgi:hypothetical protein